MSAEIKRYPDGLILFQIARKMCRADVMVKDLGNNEYEVNAKTTSTIPTYERWVVLVPYPDLRK